MYCIINHVISTNMSLQRYMERWETHMQKLLSLGGTTIPLFHCCCTTLRMSI